MSIYFCLFYTLDFVYICAIIFTVDNWVYYIIALNLKRGVAMLKYKINVMNQLKSKGYTTYRIRKENLLAQSTITKLNNGIIVSNDVVDVLCRLLDCQPGDIIEYVEEGDDT